MRPREGPSTGYPRSRTPRPSLASCSTGETYAWRWAPGTSTRLRAGWWANERDRPSGDGPEGFPDRAPVDRANGRRRRVLRARRARERAAGAARLGAGRGHPRERRGVGLDPADRRRGRHGPGAEARPYAGGDRAAVRAHAVRRGGTLAG